MTARPSTQDDEKVERAIPRAFLCKQSRGVGGPPSANRKQHLAGGLWKASALQS